MSGLVLKLSPRERVLVNGVVIENGDKRTKISIVTESANILRLKDAIHPDNAHTPVARLCYIAQLVLSGDADPRKAKQQLISGIEQLKQIFIDHDSATTLADARKLISDDRIYPGLRRLRDLLHAERKILEVGS